MIESNYLLTLIAIEKEQSFSKAAEVMGVTQSAVSQNIKTLEKKIGLQLVHRSGKMVKLTAEGARLARVGREFIRKIENTVADIREDKNILEGQVNIGTLFGVGKSWVANACIEFQQKYPKIKVQFIMDFPEELAERFQRHELDCLVLPENLAPASCEKVELCREYSTLVFPKKFEINEKSSLKEILQFPLLFFEDNDPLFTRWCKERFRSSPKNLKAHLVINSFGHILEAVHKGLGIAVVPTHVFIRNRLRKSVGHLGLEHDVFNDLFTFCVHPSAMQMKRYQYLYQTLKDAALQWNRDA